MSKRGARKRNAKTRRPDQGLPRPASSLPVDEAVGSPTGGAASTDRAPGASSAGRRGVTITFSNSAPSPSSVTTYVPSAAAPSVMHPPYQAVGHSDVRPAPVG